MTDTAMLVIAVEGVFFGVLCTAALIHLSIAVENVVTELRKMNSRKGGE